MAIQFEEFESFASSPLPAPVASPLVRLKYLIDNTPAIIYSSVASGDFKMTFVSANARNVLGYAPEEMLEQGVSMLYPDAAAYEKAGGESYSRLSDGSAFIAERELLRRETVTQCVRTKCSHRDRSASQQCASGGQSGKGCGAVAGGWVV